MPALSWQRAQVIRDYIAAVGLAREEGRIEVEAAAFAAWRSWALAHAGSLDFIASGNPLVSLEEAPEKLVEPGAGAAERGYASAGSPGWFPGRKWYHR